MKGVARLLKYVSFVTLGIVVLLLMLASVIEKLYGREVAMNCLYTSPMMVVLWSVAGIAGVAYLFKRQVQRRWATMGIHVAFLIILAGALVTHVFGEQGSIHLRLDSEPVDEYKLAEGVTSQLPYALKLKQFELRYYDGTLAPMDYVTTFTIVEKDGLCVEGEVSMNNVFDYRGYRFYQSGYDSDQSGSILMISHDPIGIAVTYMGYGLLLISLLAFFFQRNSGFRRLLHHEALHRRLMLIALLMTGCAYASAGEKPKVLPEDVAAQFGNMRVYYNDRICPLQTLAKDFTTKVYGKSSYRGLTAEQVLTGWFFFYDDWKHEPMIKIKGNNVREALGINGKYARLIDFTDVNGYKLEKLVGENKSFADRRNVEQANEQFNIVSMVCTGTMLKLYPYASEDGSVKWLSMTDKLPEDMTENQWIFIKSSMNYVAEKVAMKDYEQVGNLLTKIMSYQKKEAGALPSDLKFVAEKVYNKTSEWVGVLAVICLSGGIIMFFLQMVAGSLSAWIFKIEKVLNVIIVVFISVIMMLRGYVSGHVPLANGHETMMFMALVSGLLSMLGSRRVRLVMPFGLLLSGLTMMVATMSSSNPQITNLMPVLQSPLLSLHVVVIMIAYVLLAFAMFNGIAAIVIYYGKKDCHHEIEHLKVISNIIIYPAVFLLAAGIFIGAVWANVSWGRYWGWDPKEVWALITMLVYSAALHSDSLSLFKRPMFFHVFCIIAFVTVLITYFGVNFILGGMHSYA